MNNNPDKLEINIPNEIIIDNTNTNTNTNTNIDNPVSTIIFNNEMLEKYYNDNMVSPINRNDLTVFTIEHDNDDLKNAINNIQDDINNINNITNVINDDEYEFNKNSDNIDIDDPWDSAINDNKFIINNKIIRIFPQLKNSSNFSKIKIDDESLSYITIREIADLTSKIISHHLIKYNINPQKTKIADYTSGVGGNVLSFCKYFNHVYAIELSKIRYEYLVNNVGVYNFKNVTCINDSSINFTNDNLHNLDIKVIFIDPPWGGSEYKNNDTLKLELGGVPIEELIIKIFNNFATNLTKNNNNKFIILKLPRNYDVEHMYNYIKNHNIKNYTICTYLYILNKMLIVVCEITNISISFITVT
jgi:16S rRNA G966 N2-methylase RsmD